MFYKKHVHVSIMLVSKGSPSFHGVGVPNFLTGNSTRVRGFSNELVNILKQIVLQKSLYITFLIVFCLFWLWWAQFDERSYWYLHEFVTQYFFFTMSYLSISSFFRPEILACFLLNSPLSSFNVISSYLDMLMFNNFKCFPGGRLQQKWRVC